MEIVVVFSPAAAEVWPVDPADEVLVFAADPLEEADDDDAFAVLSLKVNEVIGMPARAA